MAIIIDGYNLLHASDIFGDAESPDAAQQTAFELSRSALIAFVAKAVGPKLAAKTTLVFDAADAPPGLPNNYRQHGIMLRFARRHTTADELIGELIERSRQPKQLLVVSSDHAVQRMARQRGASYVDSQAWFAEQRSALRRRQDDAHPANDPVKSLRQGELSREEVRRWLEEFGG
jgi:uncharacterized protein